MQIASIRFVKEAGVMQTGKFVPMHNFVISDDNPCCTYDDCFHLSEISRASLR